MIEFVDKACVKLNNSYSYIYAADPTVAEKEPTYFNGDTWLSTNTGSSWVLKDQTAGTWQQIEIAEDAKIGIFGSRVFDVVTRYLNNNFLVPRNEDYEDSYSFPSGFTREQAFLLASSEGVYIAASFDSALKKISAASTDDVAGSLTASFQAGDTIFITGSLRNNGYYTIDTVTDTEIVVVEDGFTTSDSECFIFLADVSDALISIVCRMVWFDVFRRDQFVGLASERIGTYSWSKGASVGGIMYPEDVVAGLETFRIVEIGGHSVFVN